MQLRSHLVGLLALNLPSFDFVIVLAITPIVLHSLGLIVRVYVLVGSHRELLTVAQLLASLFPGVLLELQDLLVSDFELLLLLEPIIDCLVRVLIQILPCDFLLYSVSRLEHCILALEGRRGCLALPEAVNGLPNHVLR